MSTADSPEGLPQNDEPSGPFLTTYSTPTQQEIDEAAIRAFKAISKIDTEKVVVLSFRDLQLKRIGELQDQLFGLQEGLAGRARPAVDENGRNELDDILTQYANAFRNYEILSQNALTFIPPGSQLVGRLQYWTGKRRPTPENFWQRRLINAMIWLAELTPKIFPWSEKYSGRRMACSRRLGKLGFRELDKAGREERAQRKAFTQRLFMALFGGVALIVPMLIMVLHSTRNVSLITTSVATLLFALILAFGAQDTAGKDVLGATAAYAAVLVVFVGTSIATPPTT